MIPPKVDDRNEIGACRWTVARSGLSFGFPRSPAQLGADLANSIVTVDWFKWIFTLGRSIAFCMCRP
jgi:hypothetical protein